MNKIDFDKNDNQIIHYAWQREVVIQNTPFLDVVVISGFVENGVMAIMEKHSITSLAVVDENNKVIGIIHIHDLLRAGVA